MHPEDPLGAAQLDRALQHPVEGEEHRDLQEDRQAPAHRVDLLALIELHHRLVEALLVVLVLFLDRLHARRHFLHARHRAVAGGGNRVEDRLDDAGEEHDRPAPVPDDAVQEGKEPVDGLRKEGEPAVVDDEFKPRRDLLEALLRLRASVELGLVRDRLPGFDRRELHERADRVEVLVDGVGVVLTLFALFGNPGAHEVVLNHGDPAVVRFALIRRALVGDVRVVDLLELFFVRVDRRAREGRVHAAFAFGLAAVAGDLVVDRGRRRSLADVFDVGLHFDAVVAAREGEGLRHLEAALVGFKDDVELVGVLHVDGLAHQTVFRAVVRIVAAHEPRLRDVGARRGRLEEDEVAEILGGLAAQHEPRETDFGPVGLARHHQHFGADDARTLEVERDLHAVGRDLNGLHGLFRGALRGVHGRDRPGRGDFSRRRFGRLLVRARMEDRLAARVDLVVVPQHEERGTKNHPKQGALEVFSHRALLMVVVLRVIGVTA